MKIIFAGSPEPARKTLELLFQNQAEYGFEIAGVLSNPPSPQGRHKKLVRTPVADFAAQNQLVLFEPEHLDFQARNLIEPLKADLLVSFAYGHIFGPKFLSLFPLGGINLHPSLLPKYRGCSPVPSVILNREKQTAVSVQTLSLKMDEGDILSQKKLALDGTETTASLLDESAKIGAELILDILKETSKNGCLPKGKPQDSEASYTGFITKNDARIDWSKSADVIEAAVRAYYPEPGAWCIENEGTLRILRSIFIEENDERVQNYREAVPGTVVAFVKSEGIYIRAKSGFLCVTELQRQGKNSMRYIDFMNGARNFVGTQLK